jgi:rRNA maturation RNase YbeY
MPFEVAATGVRAKALSAKLRAQALALLKLCRLEEYELSLLLTDDRTMRKLNRRFRGQDHSTDVLAFPQIDSPLDLRAKGRARTERVLSSGSVPLLLGDVVISLDTARRQARELGVGLQSRLRALFIHGFLHLLGYDHESSAVEARRMFKRERELQRSLDKLNLGVRRTAPAR